MFGSLYDEDGEFMPGSSRKKLASIEASICSMPVSRPASMLVHMSEPESADVYNVLDVAYLHVY